MSDADVLLSAQQILEENEDIFAAVVENLQLGRMDECIKHYSVLHRNVVAMAQALDNYPTSIKDPHETVKLFPDDIMRKDVLDELQPPGQTPLPKAPPAPPCSRCAVQKFSAHKCRVELEHIEPNAQFTYTERIEFLQVAQLLEMKDRQQKSDNRKANKPKRTYQLWTASERYLLLLGIALYGVKAYENISKLFEDRSMSQIRSFIGKRLTAEEIADAVAKKLPEPPEDFRFPKRLGEVVDAYGKFTDDVLNGKVDLASFALSSSSDGRAAADGAAARQYPSSVIAPRSGPFDWASMLGIASSTDNAVGSASSSHSGNNCSSGSNSSSAPKLPTLAGMLLMQPATMDAQTPVTEHTPKSRGTTAPTTEVGSQKPAGKAKRAHTAAKKNSKVSKAVMVNREGDEIMLTQSRKRNKSIESSDESGSPLASSSSSSGIVKGKGMKNGGDQNKKSKPPKKKNAAQPDRAEGIRSAAWTPWTTSASASSCNASANTARNFSADQSSRFFCVGNQFGMENSMALLPDTYSNISVPPLSPSQTSNMLYLPGDSESSLALLPLDLSMSSPAK